MAYVADMTTEEERGKGMGLMGAAMGLGFVLGPGIGGIMGDHNTPFFVAGGLSIFTFLLTLIFLPESLKFPEHGESTAEPAPYRSGSILPRTGTVVLPLVDIESGNSE